MRYFFVAGTVALLLLLTACGLHVPGNISLPSQLTGSDPQTLDAATKAAQEFVDRRAAGDFAGVWLMYDKQIQDDISQADYVTLSQTCGSNLEKIPVTATGVRMEDDTHALVRVKPLGFAVQLPVVYENGKWLMAPSDDFAADLGKPVAQIIADRKAAKNCGDEDLSSRLGPQPSAAATTTTSTPSGPVVTPGTQYAFPAQYSEATPASEQPSELDFDYRFHSLSSMSWSAWGPDGAVGTGNEFVQIDCLPNCAGGHGYSDFVNIYLSNPLPATADTKCSGGALFYSDVVIAYPSTVPPHDPPNMWTENNPNMEWTVYDGMTAAHCPDRKPSCSG